MIPLAKPVIGPREEQLVLEVLRSGQLSLGPRVPAFEQVAYTEAWPGISVTYERGTGGPKSAYLVAAGADPGWGAVAAATAHTAPAANIFINLVCFIVCICFG